ncbi:4a-hydroxytetrahydrobiopterin dehydratase [Streptomyces sp. NPDC090085]|uniref:4a-hydroxytetrahydrobiopterin dehydratase n=1 Tax=Streptomyces sp. NPDC090085 TaxID=3365943 RepID=UPI0037F5AD34
MGPSRGHHHPDQNGPPVLQQLTTAQLIDAIASLPGWTAADSYLTATFTVPRDQVPALLAAAAAVEDEAGHHALTVVLGERVAFSLHTTEDDSTASAITVQDTDLATHLNRLALHFGGQHAA